MYAADFDHNLSASLQYAEHASSAAFYTFPLLYLAHSKQPVMKGQKLLKEFETKSNYLRGTDFHSRYNLVRSKNIIQEVRKSGYTGEKGFRTIFSIEKEVQNRNVSSAENKENQVKRKMSSAVIVKAMIRARMVTNLPFTWTPIFDGLEVIWTRGKMAKGRATLSTT